ncbi:hypothetical protein B0T25DRAFT_618553 [Lasiosphaeria hispida]|uniref:Uncharacterized protein n=1 Tax=Lasiosphaeria hispida TaxID=260671 RepID=A0AAJ0M7U8_9PEZI|nr:hypothetical protein B0T25DRAFT_618553 [Lasiosphaeria hispida]
MPGNRNPLFSSSVFPTVKKALSMDHKKHLSLLEPFNFPNPNAFFSRVRPQVATMMDRTLPTIYEEETVQATNDPKATEDGQAIRFNPNRNIDRVTGHTASFMEADGTTPRCQSAGVPGLRVRHAYQSHRRRRALGSIEVEFFREPKTATATSADHLDQSLEDAIDQTDTLTVANETRVDRIRRPAVRVDRLRARRQQRALKLRGPT